LVGVGGGAEIIYCTVAAVNQRICIFMHRQRTLPNKALFQNVEVLSIIDLYKEKKSQADGLQ